MEEYLVGVTIDKIQNYLYYTLNNKAQESQSDDKTLQTIIQASEFVSYNFCQKLEKLFPTSEGNKCLIACSGKYIFETSLSEQQIRQRLNQIFQKYYRETNGQLIIKFVCADYIAKEDELMSVKRISALLKKSSCLNKVIEENQATLFAFQKEKNSEKLNINTHYPKFAKNINALAAEEEEINQNHFHIAVIKADLDGLGNIMSELKSYELYQKISQTLTDYISIEKLHYYTEKMGKEIEQSIAAEKSNWKKEDLPQFEVYPLYVAGDDLFFAVRIEHILNGINLCKNLLQDLDRELFKNKNCPRLSLSVGVEITYNREPIRYYYDRVSRQLDIAKNEDVYKNKVKEKNTGECSTLKVAFYGNVFLDIVNEKKEKRRKIHEVNPDKENWFYFTQNIYHMNEAIKTINSCRDDLYAGNHFFYRLLQLLSDESLKRNQIKYQNTILYHLLPQTWRTGEDKLQKAEFEILVPLMECISQKKGKHKPKDLNWKSENIKKLESYVQLRLLFSDPRFKIVVFKKAENKYAKKLETSGTTILINRSMEYLYKVLLKGSKDNSLRDIFVKKDCYKIKEKRKNGGERTVNIFRTLSIGSSMFYRIKRFEKENANEKQQEQSRKMILTMIQLTNNESYEEIRLLEEKKKSQKLQLNTTEKKQETEKQESLVPPKLFFDQTKLANKLVTEDWNENYIDSLLIFYKLKQLAIDFKTKIKNKEQDDEKNLYKRYHKV